MTSLHILFSLSKIFRNDPFNDTFMAKKLCIPGVGNNVRNLLLSGSTDRSAVTKFAGNNPSPLEVVPFHQLGSLKEQDHVNLCQRQIIQFSGHMTFTLFNHYLPSLW